MVEAQTKATDSRLLEEVGHTKHLVLGYIRSVFKKLWASKAQNTFKAIVDVKILPRFRHVSLRWLQRTLTLTLTVSLSFLPVLFYIYFTYTRLCLYITYSNKKVHYSLSRGHFCFEHFAPAPVFNHPFHHHSSSLTDHQKKAIFHVGLHCTQAHLIGCHPCCYCTTAKANEEKLLLGHAGSTNRLGTWGNITWNTEILEVFFFMSWISHPCWKNQGFSL